MIRIWAHTLAGYVYHSSAILLCMHYCMQKSCRTNFKRLYLKNNCFPNLSTRYILNLIRSYQMSWHLKKPSQLNASSRQRTAPSATVAPIYGTLCSTTPATFSSTHSPTPLIYVDHTPDLSRALYSSSATKTILPESTHPSACSPR